MAVKNDGLLLNVDNGGSCMLDLKKGLVGGASVKVWRAAGLRQWLL